MAASDACGRHTSMPSGKYIGLLYPVRLSFSEVNILFTRPSHSMKIEPCTFLRLFFIRPSVHLEPVCRSVCLSVI